MGWKPLDWRVFVLRAGGWERDSECGEWPQRAHGSPKRPSRNYTSHEALGAEGPRVLPGKVYVGEDKIGRASCRERV